MSGPSSLSLTCADVIDLAGLYVLGALEPADAVAMRAHLATCSEAHSEIAELGGVVPALATLPAPQSAPAQLKNRVLAAYRAEHSAAQVGRRSLLPAWHMPSWAAWASATAALLVVVVLGASFIGMRAETDRMNQRATDLRQAISAMSEPGAVAMLHPMTPATTASGFAAFPNSGGGYFVVVGLTPPPSGTTYQAWYMSGGHSESAGLVEVGADGYAVLSDMTPMPGMDTVMLTMEPGGGSAQPTGEPLVMGALEAHA